MLRTVAKRQMAKSSFDGAKPPKVTNAEAEIKVKDLWLLKWHGLHIVGASIYVYAYPSIFVH